MSKLTKQQRQRRELKALLRQFSFRRPKNGDLVVTAQIHRVTNVNWGKQEYDHKDFYDQIEVRGVFPKGGLHIVRFPFSFLSLIR